MANRRSPCAPGRTDSQVGQGSFCEAVLVAQRQEEALPRSFRPWAHHSEGHARGLPPISLVDPCSCYSSPRSTSKKKAWAHDAFDQHTHSARAFQSLKAFHLQRRGSPSETLTWPNPKLGGERARFFPNEFDFFRSNHLRSFLVGEQSPGV